MKKEIVIISDLWGKQKSEWLSHFIHYLHPNFYLKFYDACKLGGIQTAPYSKENLHSQFVEFGIEKAVDNLLRIEGQPKIYIGCSVGGLIAWKAALKGLRLEKLIAISSTRLRKEKIIPECSLQLYFGKDDLHQPSSEWYKTLGINNQIILPGGHDIYHDKNAIKEICHKLLTLTK